MPISKSRSQMVSDIVLALIEVSMNRDKTLRLEPYLNGREKGWALFGDVGDDRKVAFAESRNSDQLVVYTGNTLDFSMQGNTPSEEAYGRRTFFGCDQHAQAADFIMEFFGVAN